jgi:hypothetical protein
VAPFVADEGRNLAFMTMVSPGAGQGRKRRSSLHPVPKVPHQRL